MNKKCKVIGLLGALFVASIVMTGCGKEEKASSSNNDIKILEVSYNDIKDKKDVQVIDTRDEASYIGWKNKEGVSGHIKGAIDFPVEWFDLATKNDRLDKELKRRGIDVNKEVVIYSDNDVDKDVYKKFSEAGFKDVKALKGGINEYSKASGELEKLPGYNFYVSPQWVEDVMNGKKPEGYNGEKFKIVEISLPKDDDDYKSGHIEGAIYMDPNKINQIPGSRELSEYENIPIEKQRTFWGFPKDEDIKKELENAGIDKDTLVILYGSTKATTAANRVALVMDYAGVKNIKIINGGKPLWKLENRKLSKEDAKTNKVDFGCDVPQQKGIVFTIAQEKDFIKNNSAVIASVRSWDEYLGKISGYTYIGEAGDIENSRFAYAGSNPYAMENFRNVDNTMFNYNMIKDRWTKWGIVPNKTVSFHCGTGWRAAETYYIAKALGYKHPGVYVGGWYEWTKYPDTPKMKKGLPTDAPEKAPAEFF